MDTRELANRLFETMNTFDPYEVMDNEYTEEQALCDIENYPNVVIDGLLNIINELMP